MPSYKLLIHRFPYGGREDSECVDWLMATYHKAKSDPRFSDVRAPKLNDTPITMTRNQALLRARNLGYDFMFMVDSDMAPDVELLAGDPRAKPFYETAIETVLKSPKPCVIAAPYVGPPPHENIYVFQWTNRGNTLDPEASRTRLEQYTREHAGMLTGVQPVAALPTGLMLIDLRALDKLPHPWTYYEYKGSDPTECDACHQKRRGPEAEKASTEDVTFTRDLGLLGVPILCAWDSWAGHNKRYTARKPRPMTTDIVAHKMRDAIGRGQLAGEVEMVVEEPEWVREHEATQSLLKDREGMADRAAAFDAAASAAAGRIEFNPPAPVSIDEAKRRHAAGEPPAAYHLPGYGGLAIMGATVPASAPARSALDQTAQVVFDGIAMTQAAHAGQPWTEFMPPADPRPQPAPLAPVTPGDLLGGVPLP